MKTAYLKWEDAMKMKSKEWETENILHVAPNEEETVLLYASVWLLIELKPTNSQGGASNSLREIKSDSPKGF